MLFTSPVYSQASGSIAGITYSHGRSGMICKSKSTPTNPNTARQRTIRHAIATLGSYWGQILEYAEREAWRLYASNVSWTNVLGQTIFLTGQQHFVRCNVPRIQTSIAILEAAPIIYDLGTFTAPTLVAIMKLPQNFEIGFDNTDDWANAVGGYMLIYLGRTVGLGRNFFDGPFRYAGKIEGNPAPPASPETFDTPWIVSLDNQCWAYARVIQADGRLSLPILLGPTKIQAI